MKPTRNNRLVIAYIDPELHKKIRIWCVKNQKPLHQWAKLAHEKLSTGK